MKFQNLILYAALALAVAGCSKKTMEAPESTPPADTVTVPPVRRYSIVEGFEQGKKEAYAASDVTLSTGSWNLNDVVIGNLAGDLRNGSWSARLRTGDLAMNFDINGIDTVCISHGKYTTDKTASTWQLMVSADGGTTYTQIGHDIAENNTTLVIDTFKVSTTGKVRFKIQKTGTTRVDIDDFTFKGTGDPGITLAPPTDPGDEDGDDSAPAAAPRGVTAGNDAPPISGDNSDLLFGNPSNAQNSVTLMDNYLMDQKYYTESYNATKGEPNWVSWHLDATNVTGAVDRENNFAAYSGLPSAWFAVQSNSYNYATYGFDRGHNCPSADRSSSADANSSTFLMTNMIPQAPQNNQHTWNNLEGYLREQVTANNEVYIIMGSYGSGGTGVHGTFASIPSGTGHINVPSNVWKVAVIIPVGNGDLSRVTASTRVIAVNTPNINTANSDWKQYITTVKEIETATGYTLLSSLPADVRTALENKKDSGS